MSSLPDYLVLLLATVVLELLVVLLLSREGAWLALTSVCLNLFTHPIACWLVSLDDEPGGFVVIEVAVIAVEAVCYRIVGGLPARKAVGLSLLANALTIAVALAWLW